MGISHSLFTKLKMDETSVSVGNSVTFKALNHLIPFQKNHENNMFVRHLSEEARQKNKSPLLQ